jgi:hypothetical protein
VVRGVQRRACHVTADGGALLILSAPDVPLAPNALAVQVALLDFRGATGFRVGQAIWLGPSAPPDRDADWRVTLGGAPTWEPRPRVHRVAPRDLADRLRAARAAVIADGAGESLLPLLWASPPEARGAGPGVVRAAGAPVRLLSDAAARRDAASAARAARGLAGLGPGLTPSGDDLLAGFAAAWTLVGDALGLDRAALGRVADGLVVGARHRASALGFAWLGHAVRGEVLEPMTGFVTTLLAARPQDLGAVVRGALSVGSSSGTDWMVGFLLGGAAALGGATRGGAW